MRAEADAIHRQIVGDYLDDIMNYAPDGEKPKIRSCFLAIPRQLARETENRKFKYAEVEKGVGARKFWTHLKDLVTRDRFKAIEALTR